MIVRAKRKKYFRLILVLTALLALAASLMFLPAEAEGAAETQAAASEEKGESGEEELWDNIETILGNLDTDALDEYLASLSEEQREQFGGSDFSEKVMALLSGDYAIDYENALEAIASLVFDGLSGLLPTFCIILSIAILCGILNRFKSSFAERGTERLIFFLCYGAVLVLILSSLSGVVSDCISAVSSMRAQMQAIFPVLLTLVVTCGGSVSAAVYRPAALFLSDGVVQVVSGVVFPLAILVCVLHMAGHMNGEIKLQNFTSFFSSVIKWVLGITLTAFSVFLTVQGITSATYDGISFKAARYAIGNSVPVVGGFLSGGLDLLMAGGMLIKNSVGMCGILLLVIVIAVPLVQLVVYNLFLKLTAAVTEPVGAEGISGFLSSLSGAVNYFIAGLLAVGFMYFVTVLLLICSSNAML